MAIDMLSSFLRERLERRKAREAAEKRYRVSEAGAVSFRLTSLASSSVQAQMAALAQDDLAIGYQPTGAEPTASAPNRQAADDVETAEGDTVTVTSTD